MNSLEQRSIIEVDTNKIQFDYNEIIDNFNTSFKNIKYDFNEDDNFYNKPVLEDTFIKNTV